MEEQTPFVAGEKREYVTGRQLREWLDRLTPEELNGPVIVVTAKGEYLEYVVVDFGLAAVSGGGGTEKSLHRRDQSSAGLGAPEWSRERLRSSRS